MSGFEKKKAAFFQNSENLGCSFIKNDIHMFLPFIYKTSIIIELTKIVALNFSVYLLTILTYFLNVDVFEK